MKRTLCLLLALVLMCAAALALADEPVKLTIAIPDKVNVEDYNTNEMTLNLEAELGYDIEFVVYPATDYKAKINLMIQSGDKLPDIIIGNDSFDNASIYEWSLAGALIPLTDYYADPELAVNIQKTYEEVGDFRPPHHHAGRRNLQHPEVRAVRRQRAGRQAVHRHERA